MKIQEVTPDCYIETWQNLKHKIEYYLSNNLLTISTSGGTPTPLDPSLIPFLNNCQSKLKFCLYVLGKATCMYQNFAKINKDSSLPI